jgi:hypothetical protein
MRKQILLIGAILAGATLMAQTTIKPAVGLNFTDWSKDNVSGEFKARAGWQLGGSIAFGKKFYVEPGLFYVGKSTEFVSSDQQNFDNYKANINGIRVPVAVGANLIGSETSIIGIRGFGGLSGFFVTSTSSDIDKSQLEKANFGLFAGVGVDIWKIFVDASYEWSLTNVSKDVQNIDVGKARSIFINAGIKFNLKK